MNKIVPLVTLLLICLNIYAQTGGRGPAKRLQSDGRTITYVAVGTKPDYYAQTLDGYTLWHTATGDIVYATIDSTGQMIPSQILAADDRTAEEMAFLQTVPKGLRFRLANNKAGMPLAGARFPNLATRQDSLLVILVEFPDVQFSYSRDVFDSLFNQDNYDSTGSFKKYYYDQSGGRFDPGVRVVGPVMMPENKAYYNQHVYNYLNNTVTCYDEYMIRQAIQGADDEIDYSNYDNDGDGYVDAVLVYYAGESPATKSEGLWPHQGYIDYSGSHDAKRMRGYAIFDEGVTKPAIGTVCHEFGHCLGLPDLYDAEHSGYDSIVGRSSGIFNLMASGSWNSGGTLPPNLSVLEKSILGWGAQFDTLYPSDSVSLRAIGTAYDHAYYLPIDGDEFYAFEVRSGSDHWDSGLNIGSGGMVVYHGKESKLNTTSNQVINCTIGDEGWYIVPPVAEGYYAYHPSAFGESASLTPLSLAKPMKNDSTMLDNIWITNIRWTSDSTMAFRYGQVRPSDKTIVENIHFNNGTDVTDSSFTARAIIIGTNGPLQAKGIVYAQTVEDCSMERGMVVYDTALSDDTKIDVTVGDITPGFWYFSTFVQDNGGTTLLPPQKVITPLLSIDSAYYYTEDYDDTIVRGDIYMPYVSLKNHCRQLYASGTGIPENIKDLYPKPGSRYDVSGPLPRYFHDYSIHAVSSEDDTVYYQFDLTKYPTIQSYKPTRMFPSNFSTDAHQRNGELVLSYASVTLPDDSADASWQTATLSLHTLDSLATYYEGKYNLADLTYSQNNSLFHAIARQTPFRALSSGSTVQLPLGGDSVTVVAKTNHLGLFEYCFPKMELKQCDEDLTRTQVDCYPWPWVRGCYYSDSIIVAKPYDGTHHYSILAGTPDEMEAIGVSDVVSATEYCVGHPEQVVRYESYYLPSIDPENFSIPAESYLPNIITNLIPDSNTDYVIYTIPFNSKDSVGEVGYMNFHVYDTAVRILPRHDTAWYYFEGQVPHWGCEVVPNFTYQNSQYDITNYFGLYRDGFCDSLMSALGASEKGLIRWLIENNMISVSYGDNISTDTLQENTQYEFCVWTVLSRDIDSLYQWSDTAFTRKSFSSYIPPEAFPVAMMPIETSFWNDDIWGWLGTCPEYCEVNISSPHQDGIFHAVRDSVTVTVSANTGFRLYEFRIEYSDHVSGETTDWQFDTLQYDEVATSVLRFRMPESGDGIVYIRIKMDTARFIVNTYETAGGVVYGGIYSLGDAVTVEAIPNSHYSFISWADGSTVNPFTYIVEAHDTTFVPTFEGEEVVITTACSPENSGTISGAGAYHYGDTVKLVATPNEGWTLNSWRGYDSENSFSYFAGNDTLEYIIQNGQYGQEYFTRFEAHFDWDSVIIHIVNNDWNLGDVFGGGTYRIGDLVTLEAYPYDSCQFSHWTLSDGYTITEENPYTFLASDDYGQRELTYWANFISTNVQTHTLTLTCNPEQGHVFGGGTYDHNSIVHIIAQANPGYHFVRWDNGVTSQEYDLTLSCDSTITAIFSETSNIIDVAASQVSISAVGGKIIVSNAEGQHIDIIDAVGRVIATRHNALQTEQFEMPSGFYIVRVGHWPLSKVVVWR